MLHTVTVLEFVSRGVDIGVIKIDPLNLFMNISRGSDILGKGSNLPPPDLPGQIQPCILAAPLTSC